MSSSNCCGQNASLFVDWQVGKKPPHLTNQCSYHGQQPLKGAHFIAQFKAKSTNSQVSYSVESGTVPLPGTFQELMNNQIPMILFLVETSSVANSAEDSHSRDLLSPGTQHPAPHRTLPPIRQNLSAPFNKENIQNWLILGNESNDRLLNVRTLIKSL